MNDHRIYSEKCDIDDAKTKMYFDNRAQKDVPHRYNHVLNQDSHPEIALQRDRYEKDKMSKLLNFSAQTRILDIGCGVGRWGDEIAKDLTDEGVYVGIDYSPEMIKLATESKCSVREHFYVGSFQEIPNVLSDNNEIVTYDRILINGVLQYVNDRDIDLCMENVLRCAAPNSMVYIKEAVGRADRFTLKDFYSEELRSEYNTIFRSVKEYSDIIYKYFLSNGFYLISCGQTWPDELENRSESMSFYWIFDR